MLLRKLNAVGSLLATLLLFGHAIPLGFWMLLQGTVPAPEAAKSVLAYELTDDLRTVTLVSNPGTDKEVTQTVQIPKGLPFLLLTTLLEDSYATYADAACTQAWADVEGYDADTTVYVVWSK